MQADGELTGWFGTQDRVVAAAEIRLTKPGCASDLAFSTWELPCSEPESGMCRASRFSGFCAAGLWSLLALICLANLCVFICWFLVIQMCLLIVTICVSVTLQ